LTIAAMLLILLLVVVCTAAVIPNIEKNEGVGETIKINL